MNAFKSGSFNVSIESSVTGDCLTMELTKKGVFFDRSAVHSIPSSRCSIKTNVIKLQVVFRPTDKESVIGAIIAVQFIEIGERVTENHFELCARVEANKASVVE